MSLAIGGACELPSTVNSSDVDDVTTLLIAVIEHKRIAARSAQPYPSTAGLQ